VDVVNGCALTSTSSEDSTRALTERAEDTGSDEAEMRLGKHGSSAQNVGAATQSASIHVQCTPPKKRMCNREHIDVDDSSSTQLVQDTNAVVTHTAAAESPDPHKARPLSNTTTASVLSEHSPVPSQQATGGTLINVHLAEMTSLLNHALNTAAVRADDGGRVSSHSDKPLKSGKLSICCIVLFQSKSTKKASAHI
jgi:hypothetical protein